MHAFQIEKQLLTFSGTDILLGLGLVRLNGFIAKDNFGIKHYSLNSFLTYDPFYRLPPNFASNMKQIKANKLTSFLMISRGIEVP